MPFPAALEVVLMELSFELLREAGVRLPGAMGNTIGIVGGLIIGQAAVDANLVSPIVVIVVAFTALCSFSIPNEEFAFSFRILKFYMIALSAWLGFFGFLLGLLTVLIHLSRLRSFGIPYLMPFTGADLNGYEDMHDTIWRAPLRMMTKKYGIDPKLLHLEITESAYPENSKQIISMVDQLRSRGFIIEMDDFGSGYSSLNMLSQLRLDVLKLDMKFIQNETAQNSDRGILRLMVEMAHRMNLSVVAEGVETQQQLSRLQEIGCDYVQGYLFSKPLPQEEYDILLCRFSQQLDIPLPSVPKLAQPHPYLLAAEEDPRCRKLLREAFAETYEVVEVVDCAQALEFLACHAQELSAMIVSSTLPEPGAPVIISALRRATAPRRIPVMVMTPPQRELEVQDLGLDVDDIAYKPRDLLCLHCLRRRMEWMHTLAAYQSRERSVVSEACQDYLTGLLNRRGLQAAMDAMQKSDFPIAVYLFDIDCLRQANDQLGHGAGDRILHNITLGCFLDHMIQKRRRIADTCCQCGNILSFLWLNNADNLQFFTVFHQIFDIFIIIRLIFPHGKLIIIHIIITGIDQFQGHPEKILIIIGFRILIDFHCFIIGNCLKNLVQFLPGFQSQ